MDTHKRLKEKEQGIVSLKSLKKNVNILYWTNLKEQKDKLHFFMNIAWLKHQPELTIKRQTMKAFTPKQFTFNQFVIHQGAPANHVFIIKEGDFTVIKKYKEIRENDSKIRKFLNVGNESLLFDNTAGKHQKTDHEIRIGTLGKGNTIGMNDIIAQRDYTISLKCESATGLVFLISKEDFIVRMKRDNQTWNEIEI